MWWIAIGILFVVIILFPLAYFAWHYSRMRKLLPKPDWQTVKERPDVDSWSDSGLYASWIGHASVYLKLNGVRILTDPVLYRKVGVSALGVARIGPARYTEPALSADDLRGKVDVILLSHAHLDHLDMPTLRSLADERVQVVTAQGIGHLARRAGFKKVIELGDSELCHIGNHLVVRSVPARHWGARYPWNKGYAWTGYVVEWYNDSPHDAKTKPDTSVLFAGDTALTDTYSQLEQLGIRPDLAMMPIGAYSPDNFQGAHCTPEQAWQMFLDSGARFLLPIHWNTFVLSQEPVGEPMERLVKAAADRQGDIAIRWQGETFHLPARSVKQAGRRALDEESAAMDDSSVEAERFESRH